MNAHSETSADSPQYTECYVAFLDILGFKELVKRSVTNLNVLSNLVGILTKTADLEPTQHEKREVYYEGSKCVDVGEERRWTTQIRAFSDCIAIFVPTETNALSSILCKVRYLHDRILELGCCLRGAVAIGGMYWNDAWSNPLKSGGEITKELAQDQSQSVLYDRDAPSNAFITLGPALVEAYRLESEVAIYPRVIFSHALMMHIEAKAKEAPKSSLREIHQAAHVGSLCPPTSENASRSIREFIRTDCDGVPFLDLFHKDIMRSDTVRIEQGPMPDGRVETTQVRDGMTHEQFMRNTKKTIEALMNQKNNPEKVRAKHLWLAQYCNDALIRHNIEPVPIVW